MFSRYKSIKSSILAMMILFSLFTTVLVSTFSFYLMYSFQKRITIKSTDFNLQLISNIIEQDIRDVTAFAKLCSTNPTLINYISADENNLNSEGISAFNALTKIYTENKIAPYVRRVIVTNKDYGKLLQVGSFMGSSEPINIYNINRLRSLTKEDNRFEAIIFDPFYPKSITQTIPFSTPMSSEEKEVGNVFLAISPEIILDKLRGYSLLSGSKIYFTINQNSYEIVGSTFIPSDTDFKVIGHDYENVLSPTTVVTYIKDSNNKNAISVEHTIRDNITLTQVIPIDQMILTQGNWFFLLIVICLFIIILALNIVIYMDRNINKPIANLNHRIDLISDGDFSYDPTIETQNELGQVGIGINKLSHDLEVLLASKIEDEKNKRLLEYRMLQNQINPHFLYNTLNSIKMMAIIQSAEGIAEMTTSLSKLLRSVSKDTRTLVPLREELDLLDTYIVIQKYRYSDSVIVIKEIADDNLLNTLIPRFSLQPIVENAIFHGIEPKGSGTITIKVYFQDDSVLCSIKDDGVGMSKDSLNKILSNNSTEEGLLGSIGILNVDQRLRNSFGQDYGLIIQSVLGSHTTMTVRLPIDKEMR